MCDILYSQGENKNYYSKLNTKRVEKEIQLTTKEYLNTMEKLYCEYEQSCRLLEKRIEFLVLEQTMFDSRSQKYMEFYNRIRRLRRCLDQTRAWQNMIKKYLLAGGMSDEQIDILTHSTK